MIGPSYSDPTVSQARIIFHTESPHSQGSSVRKHCTPQIMFILNQKNNGLSFFIMLLEGQGELVCYASL